MRVREKRQFGYSSVHKRVGRWLAGGSLNLSALRLSRPLSGRLYDVGEDEADADDGNGDERAEMVDQGKRSEFCGK